MLVHVESVRRKDGFEVEVKDAHHLYQYGTEIKIDSMQNDGPQSWIVIIKGMNNMSTSFPKRMLNPHTTKK